MPESDMQLSHRFEEALTWATQLHASQERKGTGIPYVSHVLAVAAIALEHGATENEAIAALLHDAVEDQGGARTLAEIETRFGTEVAGIVSGCSDTDTIPKPPWRERKEAYVAHLTEASKSVRLVSASDKLHNARAILSDLRLIGEALWGRFSGGRDGTLWYYRALAEAFRIHGPARLASELGLVVREIERLSVDRP